MSETDELRRSLDERGVEYNKKDRGRTCITSWGKAGINRAVFSESGIGTPLHGTRFVVENITAEQATAATLKAVER